MKPARTHPSTLELRYSKIMDLIQATGFKHESYVGGRQLRIYMATGYVDIWPGTNRYMLSGMRQSVPGADQFLMGIRRELAGSE